MKIALFGRAFSENFNQSIAMLFEKLKQANAEIVIHKTFASFLTRQAGIEPGDFKEFDRDSGLPHGTDVLFSLGGDGTFLETLEFVQKSSVPVLGINTGRLGFLANISRDEISEAMDLLFSGDYSLEDRSLIRLTTSNGPLDDFNTALNEVTIHKQNASMITIYTELDGEYLNTYWADGLIISTPTGSTAYSMSVGGPITLPEARNFIISPISPHNLTVRPIVVPDDKKITLRVKSRSDQFLVAMDSRSYIVSTPLELFIDRAPYGIKMIKFSANNFYNTLRNKLMWGMDRRN
ncbi:MAG: NAD kinase [Bacteroidales bacterium]|nr:NAD kinase [Bacteroidales bacterium]